jgi:hypothetical protein
MLEHEGAQHEACVASIVSAMMLPHNIDVETL